MCSGSVQALKTRWRGASKIRVIRSSCWVDSAAASLLAAILLLLRLQIAQIILEAIEALLPETAVMLEPVGGVLERPRPQAARPPLRVAPASDQTGAPQNFEMPGDCGKAHFKGLGQLSDGSLPRGEAREDRAPGRIGEGGESAAEVIGRPSVVSARAMGLVVNHLVK